MAFILSIDQGTTSTRAILFDSDMRSFQTVQKEFTQYFPHPGWVEHNPSEILHSVNSVCSELMVQSKLKPRDIAAIGITNQRETVVVWERNTGNAITNAIVWQDRRTSDLCRKLDAEGHEILVTEKTGLVLDPYFSATKLCWILNNIEGARKRAEAGELLFGTIDSFLIWHLTNGKSHVTDATNASRTMLYDIFKGDWSDEICNLLNIPLNMLPRVSNSADDFGVTQILGGHTPIFGVAGDQQAATLGQTCFKPSMLKSTYGTGCFALLNTGERPIKSSNRLLTTIAYQLDDKAVYALEGSIYNAGSVVQWLRDGLKIIDHASKSDQLASQADELHNLILVPAFTGLGAPYWNSQCRGAIYGITRNTKVADLISAALQSVAFQTRDLLEAMYADYPDFSLKSLRVDGGMCASNFTMQFLANILGIPVERPQVIETTALGVAWLAGMRAGIYPNQDIFAKKWAIDRRFDPQFENDKKDFYYKKWKSAVQATLSVEF